MSEKPKKRVAGVQFLPDTDGDRPAASSIQRWNGREAPFGYEFIEVNYQRPITDEGTRSACQALMDYYNR
ncbi:MAG: hypothetical protein ACE5H9_00945 [Anaerolineae bacterium]